MQSKTNKLNIGLTGGIGSGKSLVAKQFEDKGIYVIDADQVTRELMMPDEKAYLAIVDYFGNSILQEDKTLNRRVLREIVFKNTQHKHWLENLLHPLVREKMASRLNASTSDYVISMIPLLIETLPNPMIDRILVVMAAEKIRIQRIIERDHCNAKLAKEIIRSQVDDKTRQQHADDIIYNDSDIDTLKQQIERLHQDYLKLARAK